MIRLRVWWERRSAHLIFCAAIAVGLFVVFESALGRRNFLLPVALWRDAAVAAGFASGAAWRPRVLSSSAGVLRVRDSIFGALGCSPFPDYSCARESPQSHSYGRFFRSDFFSPTRCIGHDWLVMMIVPAALMGAARSIASTMATCGSSCGTRSASSRCSRFMYSSRPTSCISRLTRAKHRGPITCCFTGPSLRPRCWRKRSFQSCRARGQRSRNGVSRRAESGRAMVPARDEARRQRCECGHAGVAGDRREAGQFAREPRNSPSRKNGVRASPASAQGLPCNTFSPSMRGVRLPTPRFVSMCADRGRRLRLQRRAPAPAALESPTAEASIVTTPTPEASSSATIEATPAVTPEPTAMLSPLPVAASFAACHCRTDAASNRDRIAGCDCGRVAACDRRAMTALSPPLAVIIGFAYRARRLICLRRRPLQ